MNKQEFKTNIDLYGADIGKWPERIRQIANTALLSSSEFQLLIEEEKVLNDALNLRTFEKSSSNLENRIISAALKGSATPAVNSKSLFEYIGSIFNSFNLPNPAYALSMVLVIGITLGYVVNNSGDEINNDNLLANEISFYDGDFYEYEN